MSRSKNKHGLAWLLTLFLTVLLVIILSSVGLNSTVFSANFTSNVLTQPRNVDYITKQINHQIDQVQQKHHLPITLPAHTLQPSDVKPIIKTTVHRLYNGYPEIFNAQQILDIFLNRLQKLNQSNIINFNNKNLPLIWQQAQAYVAKIISEQLNTSAVQEQVINFSNLRLTTRMIMIGSILFFLLFLMLLLLQQQQEQRWLHYLGISLLTATFILAIVIWSIIEKVTYANLPFARPLIANLCTQALNKNICLLVITAIEGIVLLLIDHFRQHQHN